MGKKENEATALQRSAAGHKAPASHRHRRCFTLKFRFLSRLTAKLQTEEKKQEKKKKFKIVKTTPIYLRGKIKSKKIKKKKKRKKRNYGILIC